MKTIKKIALPLAAIILMMSIFLLTAFADSGSAASGQTLVAVSIETVAEFERSEASLAAGSGTWALMDVILCAVTLLAAIAVLREGNIRDKAMAFPAAAAAAAVTGITQNFGGSLVLADRWTLLMGLFAVGCMVLSEHRTMKKA